MTFLLGSSGSQWLPSFISNILMLLVLYSLVCEKPQCLLYSSFLIMPVSDSLESECCDTWRCSNPSIKSVLGSLGSKWWQCPVMLQACWQCLSLAFQEVSGLIFSFFHCWLCLLTMPVCGFPVSKWVWRVLIFQTCWNACPWPLSLWVTSVLLHVKPGDATCYCSSESEYL